MGPKDIRAATVTSRADTSRWTNADVLVPDAAVDPLRQLGECT